MGLAVRSQSYRLYEVMKATDVSRLQTTSEWSAAITRALHAGTEVAVKQNKSLAENDVQKTSRTQKSSSPPKTIPRNSPKPRALRKSSPALKGRILESIVLEPGSRWEAHFRPKNAQMDFVVSGDARIGILRSANDLDIHYASDGEVVSIPTDCGHWVENMGDKASLLVLVIESEESSVGSVTNWGGLSEVSARVQQIRAKLDEMTTMLEGISSRITQIRSENEEAESANRGVPAGQNVAQSEG